MTNPVWPANLTPAGLEWRLQKSGVQFRSPFTGSLQANGFLGEYWDITIALRGEGARRLNSGALEALLMNLAGGRNQIDIYHWVRPFPYGSMRGNPTLQVVTIRGDSQLILNVAAGATLYAGDLIGAGNQVFMVKANCKAVGTTLTVPVLNHARGVIAEDSAVIWNRPKVAVVAPDLSAGLVYRPGMTLPTELHLVEP